MKKLEKLEWDLLMRERERQEVAFNSIETKNTWMIAAITFLAVSAMPQIHPVPLDRFDLFLMFGTFAYTAWNSWQVFSVRNWAQFPALNFDNYILKMKSPARIALEDMRDVVKSNAKIIDEKGASLRKVTSGVFIFSLLYVLYSIFNLVQKGL